jgi:hypothetical protein
LPFQEKIASKYQCSTGLKSAVKQTASLFAWGNALLFYLISERYGALQAGQKPSCRHNFFKSKVGTLDAQCTSGIVFKATFSRKYREEKICRPI